MRKFSKTTILTLWMDVMTMTTVNKMGNNFKCWRILGKLVSFVMVNVHWRTATIQPEQDFNHPPPMAKIHSDAHFPARGFPKPDRHIVFNPKRSYIKILKRGYFIGISFTYMLNSGNFIKVYVCIFDHVWINFLANEAILKKLIFDLPPTPQPPNPHPIFSLNWTILRK